MDGARLAAYGEANLQRALVRAGVYLSSTVIHGVVKDLMTPTSLSGRRGRRYKGRSGKGPEVDEQYQAGIDKARADVARIQKDYADLLRGEFEYGGGLLQGGMKYKVRHGSKQFEITKAKLEKEAKAATEALRAAEKAAWSPDESGSVYRQKFKSDTGPGSKQWRRFARDRRRGSRMRRYASSSGAARFVQRFGKRR